MSGKTTTRPRKPVKEMKRFDQSVEEWHKTHAGEWVLMKGDDPPLFFKDDEEAYCYGRRTWPGEQFWLKQVVLNPPLQIVPWPVETFEGDIED